MKRDLDDALRRAYSLKSPDEVVNLYRDWADRYDQDTVERLGYVAPRTTVEEFARHFTDTGGLVLDAGCGTGLAAVELLRLGFKRLHGLDISPEMLERARERGLYEEVFVGDLTATLDADDDRYDAVVSVGTFTHGHVGPEGLDELLRVTRAGGVISLSINEGVYESYRFEEAFSVLERDGRARLLANVSADYILEENIGCRIATLSVGDA